MRDALRRDPGLAFVLLALALVAVLYGPTLGYGLTNYDDTWLVRDNFIAREPAWDHLRSIAFDLDSDHRLALGAEYLPVRDLSIMLDAAVWGDTWGGYHATNVILYGAAIVAWFCALARFGVDRRIAGLALLIWAVHPAHAETVAWISERKGALGMLFAGVAVLGHARFRAGGGARWLAIGAIAAVCAVWSKAPAAFAVAALAALELLLPGRVSWRRSVVSIAVIGAVALAAYVPVVVTATRMGVVGNAPPLVAGRLASVIGFHGFYLRLAAMEPANAVTYAIADDGPSVLDLALGALGLVAVGVALWRGPLRVAAALWLLGWLPVSHLILPVQTVAIADRYLLFASLGAALALAVAVVRIDRAAIRRALLAVIVLAASLRTFDARRSWANPIALWGRATESAPQSAYAWSQLAEAYADARDPDAALAATEEGLAHVDAPALWLRKALLLLARNDPAAIAWLRRAADAGEVKAMSNLALLLEQNQPDEALAWARRGAAADPASPHAQRTLGKIALDTGHVDEALVAFRHAVDREPHNTANRFDLALALLALHRDAEARPFLESCLDGPPALAARARALLAK